MLCAVIMAGGKGTRFWPLSTEEKPKQFLNLIGEKTMIQMTVERILPIIPIERIFISTGRDYVNLVREQLPQLPVDNIIIEPVGRNTAPCIGLSALHIKKKHNDATMVVLPSDHLVKDDEDFVNTLKCGEEYLNKNPEATLTIGMTPNRPETGYGYIKFTETYNEVKGKKVIEVEKFVEKPNMEKAIEYYSSGNYLWNGGMFLWKVENLLELMETHLKSTFDILNTIVNSEAEVYESILNENYCKTENISIDYGILEKVKNICVIPGDFGWDDVGSWFALERYKEKDENDNTIVGEVRNLGGKGNIVVGSTKPIVIAGLEDVILVESEEMIFLAKKENINDISEIRKRYVG